MTRSAKQPVNRQRDQVPQGETASNGGRGKGPSQAAGVGMMAAHQPESGPEKRYADRAENYRDNYPSYDGCHRFGRPVMSFALRIVI
jgi:hypothetical protein